MSSSFPQVWTRVRDSFISRGFWGIPVAETIGVGDAANDLEMIQAAGLGVGVANVSDDVRPYCDLVLETIGWDGAFPELVERVLEAR